MIRTSLALVTLALSTAGNLPGADKAPPKPGDGPEAIFEAKKVWDIHLTFTTEQWAAMEPVQGSRPPRRPNGTFLQGPEGGRNGIAAAFGIQFNHAKADLEFGSRRVSEVGVRYKGNGTFLSSRDSLKRSMKLDFNHFVKGRKLAGLTQLNLHNSVRDPSHMNEAIAYKLFRDCGVPAPRTSFAKVHVTVPDTHERKYFGLYNVVEDVGSRFAEDHFGAKGGALLKPVTPQLFADLGDDWKDYNQTYDPKGDLSDDQKKRIIQTCKFFTRVGDAEFAENIGDYIELENLARYLAVTAWLTDLDGILGPGQNYYVYLHPETGKFSFIPWDQDQVFGQFPRGSHEQRETLSIRKPWTGNGNRFLEKMFKVEAFKTKYLAMLKEFNGAAFRPDRFAPQVDELAALLRAPVAEESDARLGSFNKAAAGEILPLEMGPGFREPVPVKPIKMFVNPRSKSVTEQLAGKSQGSTIDR
jgi:spore coat protein H